MSVVRTRGDALTGLVTIGGIRTETSVLNEVVELATYRLYAPQTVRVTCAAAAPRRPRAGNAEGQPLARARQSTVSRRELGDSDNARSETR